MRNIIVISTMFATTACTSSDSGLDRNIELGTLTSAEISQECDFVASLPSKSATCSDGSVATVGGTSKAACVAMFNAVPASCTATVGNADDCFNGMEADPCNGPFSAACNAIGACQ
jgi:hypothetical protein